MTDRRLRIAIVDAGYPHAYGPRSLETGALGGTEATVLRIVGALRRDIDFELFQKGRICRQSAPGLCLLPLDSVLDHPPADAIIVVNAWRYACLLRHIHPATPLSVWLHLHPQAHDLDMGKVLADAGIGLICVSCSHADDVRTFLKHRRRPDISIVHNPIDDDLCPDATPRDPNRLIFASSPHKGLDEVLIRFQALRRRLPDLELELADPGYLRWDIGELPEGVRRLGSLRHARLIQHMRRALCLFHPQTTFAETFGIVIAEANAVGTPAIVHKGLGANDEVASGQGTLDVTDLIALQNRIERWQADSPVIHANDGFRLSNVASVWQHRFDAMLRNRPVRRTRAVASSSPTPVVPAGNAGLELADPGASAEASRRRVDSGGRPDTVFLGKLMAPQPDQLSNITRLNRR